MLFILFADVLRRCFIEAESQFFLKRMSLFFVITFLIGKGNVSFKTFVKFNDLSSSFYKNNFVRTRAWNLVEN